MNDMSSRGKLELTIFRECGLTAKRDKGVEFYPIKHRRQHRGSCSGESYGVLAITGTVPLGIVHTRSDQIRWTVGLVITKPVAIEVYVKLSFLGVLEVGEVQKYHEGRQSIVVPPYIGECCVIASCHGSRLQNRLGLHKPGVWFNGSGGRHVCPAVACPSVSIKWVKWKPS